MVVIEMIFKVKFIILFVYFIGEEREFGVDGEIREVYVGEFV